MNNFLKKHSTVTEKNSCIFTMPSQKVFPFKWNHENKGYKQQNLKIRTATARGGTKASEVRFVFLRLGTVRMTVAGQARPNSRAAAGSCTKKRSSVFTHVHIHEHSRLLREKFWNFIRSRPRQKFSSR